MSESKLKDAANEKRKIAAAAEREIQEALRNHFIEKLDGVACNFLVILQGKHATQCLVGGDGAMPLTMAADLLQVLARGFYGQLFKKDELFALQHIAKMVHNRGTAVEEPEEEEPSAILTRGPLLDAKGKPILN